MPPRSLRPWFVGDSPLIRAAMVTRQSESTGGGKGLDSEEPVGYRLAVLVDGAAGNAALKMT